MLLTILRFVIQEIPERLALAELPFQIQLLRRLGLEPVDLGRNIVRKRHDFVGHIPQDSQRRDQKHEKESEHIFDRPQLPVDRP